MSEGKSGSQGFFFGVGADVLLPRDINSCLQSIPQPEAAEQCCLVLSARQALYAVLEKCFLCWKQH